MSKPVVVFRIVNIVNVNLSFRKGVRKRLCRNRREVATRASYLEECNLWEAACTNRGGRGIDR